jgi:hypothetical protein
MTIKEIKKLLENDLLNDGKMSHGLYEYELEELVDDFKESLIEDNDDFLFVVTTMKNDVNGKLNSAMVLIEKSGDVHINEAARTRLKELWLKTYAENMKKLIPGFAKQLHHGYLAINGVKTALVA